MLFLKKLKLKNFCNYEDHTFDFTKPDGTPYKFISFFGPNGIGKTTVLEAISLLSSDHSGRPGNFISNSLRKYVRNVDYSPSYNTLTGGTYKNEYMTQQKSFETEMLIEGTYDLDGKEYVIAMTQSGWTRNDFCPIPEDKSDPEAVAESAKSGVWGENHIKYKQRLCHYISSNSDLSLSKFQINVSNVEIFENIISRITKFPTKCILPSDWTDSKKEFCTDVVLQKKNYLVHYKRMSSGEKHICKSFSDLLNTMHALSHPKMGDPDMTGWPRLLLMDEFETHVYYDRHIDLANCLKEIFRDQQIFVTTHSGTLIERHLKTGNTIDDEKWFNLETI